MFEINNKEKYNLYDSEKREEFIYDSEITNYWYWKIIEINSFL